MSTFSDPILQDLFVRVVAKHGALEPIAPAQPHEYFAYLSESIISQQLSTKVADVIAARTRALIGKTWLPEKIIATEHDALRSVGLSNSKANYLRNLAEFWSQPGFSPSTLTVQDNETVITNLTTIKGIGRWTVEMFLIFGLGRPDVFSPGDGGLQRAIFRAYNLPITTKAPALVELAQAWAPQRSLASRVLWKSLEL